MNLVRCDDVYASGELAKKIGAVVDEDPSRQPELDRRQCHGAIG